ncbi:glycosyltransferase [Microbacterium sp. ASV49]|uniref:Glycosyltransferase n=1 Tax=Microbacterium candidum TaxID=3041922 RepID=A0ABT7N0R1_9MICO|nr:glycosyltransferase [Microbacterium sp. ASV49]MDL9980294.1 glycosyltransferase [Microbacterium sp. ASV49]
MTTTLRVVLDTDAEPDVARAAVELARALVRTAPSGCEVAAIVPGGSEPSVPGLADVRRLTFGRRELLTAWQLGVTAGVGGGLIHAPSLLAPLTRHDRVHDNDQTVVTLWDLDAWEAPSLLPRGVAAWQRAMLKRAQKHADAVVVPTHAMAASLEAVSKLAGRIRVISGAAPTGFAVPTDAVGRRRTMGVPEGTIVVAGIDGVDVAFEALAAARVSLPVIVLDAGEGDEPAIADHAAAAGIPESHLHVRGPLDDADRAALLDGALVLVAPSVRSAFPWRVVDALALGVPVIAASSDVHRDVLADGGTLVSPDGLGEALLSVLGSGDSLDRMSVRAADRGRAFSWRDAAERVWQLHADL